ncbi:TPA: hypothetical protein ACFP4I_000396 [Neisseria subflava]
MEDENLYPKIFLYIKERHIHKKIFNWLKKDKSITNLEEYTKTKIMELKKFVESKVIKNPLFKEHPELSIIRKVEFRRADNLQDELDRIDDENLDQLVTDQIYFCLSKNSDFLPLKYHATNELFLQEVRRYVIEFMQTIKQS